MLALAEAILRSAVVPEGLTGLVLRLLEVILLRAPTIDPVFLEVLEGDSPRRSFDLCVHRHGLSLRDLEPWLTPVVRWFLGDRVGLRDCLGGEGLEACLTHVSAGCSRRGLPYCCVYFDPSAAGPHG
jgi:hypothetical protein